MTTAQVHAKTKTVTRRFGWWDLKPGTKLWAVEKSQGLKKGEKVVRICQIEVVSVNVQQVQDVMCFPEDMELEGFPYMAPVAFIKMLCKGGHSPSNEVNRIEFKYL
jgi:hypothetical protein